jgi:hypothetical protein
MMRHFYSPVERQRFAEQWAAGDTLPLVSAAESL